MKTMVRICAEVVLFLCITFSENILKFLRRKNRIKFYGYGPVKIATALNKHHHSIIEIVYTSYAAFQMTLNLALHLLHRHLDLHQLP